MPQFFRTVKWLHGTLHTTVWTPHKTGLDAKGSYQDLRYVSASLWLGWSNSRHSLSLSLFSKKFVLLFYFIYAHHSNRSGNRLCSFFSNKLYYWTPADSTLEHCLQWEWISAWSSVSARRKNSSPACAEVLFSRSLWNLRWCPFSDICRTKFYSIQITTKPTVTRRGPGFPSFFSVCVSLWFSVHQTTVWSLWHSLSSSQSSKAVLSLKFCTWPSIFIAIVKGCWEEGLYR